MVTRGFTLIEAMVVVAVIAVFTTVAAPSFGFLIARHRTKSVASDMHLTLVKARSEALKRSSNVRVAPNNSSAWQQGWRILDESSAGCSTATPCVLDSIPQAAGVTIASAPADVTYQSSGRIRGGTAPSFLVTSSGNASVQRCVSAATSGRPYIKGSAC
jgi:prepilin-type N-terminal cleavage/methylation domain-containing protein